MRKKSPLSLSGWGTALLFATALASSSPAMADCSLTAGGGTVAAPADGATITCVAAGGDHTASIGGDTGGNLATTVDIQDNATIDISGNHAIVIDDLILTLASNATLQTNGNNDDGVLANDFGGGSASVVATLSGNGAQITAQGNSTEPIGVFSNRDTILTVTLSGDNTLIQSQADNSNALRAISFAGAATTQSIVTIDLSGDNAQILTQGMGAEAVSASNTTGTAQLIATVGSNTSIISNQAVALEVSGAAGTNPVSTIDNSGLIQGGTNSILLDDGNDIITLRTGSNLSSPTGADAGAGNDTVTLVGTGTEDEIFLNVETLNMDGTDWTLTGTSTFDDINVNSGTLTNNGHLTANNNITVALGATLEGTGMLTGPLTNNGRIAPGNSIGTQTIIGNFVQNSGGTLEIEVNKAGGTDLLDVTGTASLDGTVEFVALDEPIAPGTVYTFIQTTGGITGSFSTITDNLALVDFNVGVVGNDVQATAQSAVGTIAETRNAQSVARALEQAIAAGSTGAGQLNTLLGSITNTQTISNLFSSQTGEIGSASILSAIGSMGIGPKIIRSRLNSLTSFQALTGISSGNSYLYEEPLNKIEPAAGNAAKGNAKNRILRDTQKITDQNHQTTNQKPENKTKTQQTRYASLPPALPTQKKTVWIQGTGGFGDIDGDSTVNGIEYDTYGVAAGIETETSLLNRDATVGIFTSLSSSESNIDQINDQGQSDVYQLGVYAAWQLDPQWTVNGSLSGAWMDFETTRPTVAGRAVADFNGYSAFMSTEASYTVEKESVSYQPFAAIKSSSTHHESYQESGAGLLNMSVEDETTTQLSSELGVRATTQTYVGEWQITPAGEAAWAHEYLDQGASIRASFTTDPTIAFAINGPERDRDSARIKLNLAATPTDHQNLTLYTSYDSSIASNAQEHFFTGGLKLKW